MTKTLAKDEQGELIRTREQLCKQIENAWGELQMSVKQLERKHYYRVGEKLIQLRMTFGKGRSGDNAFGKFCEAEIPFIKKPQRVEYMAYRKRLGPITSTQTTSAEVDLPSLRKTTYPGRNHQVQDRLHQYKRVVDEEVDEPEVFTVPRTKREDENELILDLAEKIVSTGFRILSVKLHPDKPGGSSEAMRRLNAAKKLLSDALTRAELMM